MTASQSTGMIYFVQQGESGPVKIGWTQSVQQRLETIQTYNPEPLRCLGVIDGTSIAEEHALHRRFKNCHVHGEWFRPVPALMEYIGAHATPFDARLESARLPFDERYKVGPEGRQALRRGLELGRKERKRRQGIEQGRIRQAEVERILTDVRRDAAV